MGPHCTRYVLVAHAVTRAAHGGTDRIAFDGMLDGGARLTPGNYRLSLSAIAAAGKTTAAQRPAFTLLGP